MKSNVQISVVMSVYNNKDTLPAALEGILSQEGVDLEFIIIDDGSTDGCGKILDEASSRDSRLKVVHKQNEGLTRALIEGCSMASAPWIARQDADDCSLPGRLHALLALADAHPAAVMLSSWVRYVGPENEFLQIVERPAGEAEACRQIRDLSIGPPAHGSVMFLKAAYERCGGYRSEFYYGQDADLWLRMIDVGDIVYLPEVLYEYRVSPSAISGYGQMDQRVFGELGQLCHKARRDGEPEALYLLRADQLRNEILSRTSSARCAKSLWLIHYHLGSLLEKQDPRRAAYYFRLAIRYNPLAVRAVCKYLINTFVR